MTLSVALWVDKLTFTNKSSGNTRVIWSLAETRIGVSFGPSGFAINYRTWLLIWAVCCEQLLAASRFRYFVIHIHIRNPRPNRSVKAMQLFFLYNRSQLYLPIMQCYLDSPTSGLLEAAQAVVSWEPLQKQLPRSTNNCQRTSDSETREYQLGYSLLDQSCPQMNGRVGYREAGALCLPLLILHDFNQHICMGIESAFGKDVSLRCIRVLGVLSFWSRWCPKSFMDLKSLVWVPNTLTWQISRCSLIISLKWVCLSLFLARKHDLEHTCVVRGVNMTY